VKGYAVTLVKLADKEANLSSHYVLERLVVRRSIEVILLAVIDSVLAVCVDRITSPA
jgi:hypothetical protein